MIESVFCIDGKEDFTHTNFIITKAGTIYSTNPEIGFFKRDDLTRAKLKNHVFNMVMEGFTITPIKTRSTISRYQQIINNLERSAS